ncbi:MAG: DUF2752 domain-containing protein [Suipraeoptans sp.]
MSSSCPFALVTGYPCPGCGMTRAFKLLFHFKFVAAFKMHLFVYPIIIFFIAMIIYRYFLNRKQPMWIYNVLIFGLIMMIMFYIYRMIAYFPNTPPMTFCKDNVLGLKLYIH